MSTVKTVNIRITNVAACSADTDAVGVGVSESNGRADFPEYPGVQPEQSGDESGSFHVTNVEKALAIS